MTIVSRPYAGPGDQDRILALLAAAWQPWGPATYFHSGNLFWRLRDPDPQIQLWEDELGRLVTLGWFSPPDELELQIHPDYRGTDLEARVLDWGEAEARRSQAAVPARLRTWAAETDEGLVGLLNARGYQREEAFFHHMFRSLEPEVEAPLLPPGFAVRSIQGDVEAAARVAVHRAAWAPGSTMTEEKHRRLMSLSGYRRDLDLVVVDPAGRFAACCIVWWDAASGVGQFEPVGTDPAYRRLGLARAMVLEGCRRLRELGAREAFVLGWHESEAAVHLYESCGFTTRRRDYRYSACVTHPH